MASIAERLRKLDTCNLSDALDKLGLPGAALGLQRAWPNLRIAGKVQTVKLVAKGREVPKRHLCTGAVMDAEEGDIVVVDNRGRTNASGWGGILSLAAKTRGLSGVIVDGAARDIDEAIDLEFPLYAKAFIPVTARGRIVEQSYNEPVEISGISVSPGDYAVADASGVVFIRAEDVDKVLKTAEEIGKREAAMAEAVRSGRPVSEVMGESYENLISK
ncbi:MAG: RraA family protein [Rhodovibrionaceae bacterium]